MDINLEGTLMEAYVDRIMNAILKYCDLQATIECFEGCSS